MLILQESCTDSSGSLVVYSPVEINYVDIVMSGEDPTNIPLQPSSGFTILPDGRVGGPGGGASTSSNPMGSSYGSLVTVAFQILVSSLPSAKLNIESVSTVNNLISTTVQQIKAALNCPSGWFKFGIQVWALGWLVPLQFSLSLLSFSLLSVSESHQEVLCCDDADAWSRVSLHQSFKEVYSRQVTFTSRNTFSIHILYAFLFYFSF